MKWLKKTTDGQDKESDSEKELEDKRKKKDLEIKRKQEQIEKGRKKEEERRLKIQYEGEGVVKTEERKIEYTAEMIAKKLKEIVENRLFLKFFSH